MACCNFYRGCEPGTGRIVDVVINYEEGTKNAWYFDTLDDYTGVIADLEDCEQVAGVCDQVAALNELGSFPVDGLVLSLQTDGECVVAPLPSGQTDTFVTIIDNGNGTATLISPGGETSVDVCLAPCGQGGDTHIDRFDVDYCGFNTADEIPPRVVACDGPLTVTISTSTPPVGGDEVFAVLVNGVQVATLVLADGQTTVTGGTWTVADGDVVTYQMVSTTASQPSGLGSIRATIPCDGTGGGTGPCVINSQPVGATGEVGDPINLGGSVSSGGEQWQTAPTSGGAWTDTTDPATITTEGSVWYRVCCLTDPGVCSAPVEVVGTPPPSGIFDPTTPTGVIETQGNNIVDTTGTRIAGGGMNAAINQRNNDA